ncbi:MAG: adenylate cyclase [Planctomycetaceae bacterium]|nr:adenylate cyclase [Planctomycetaceae bacterium]
MMDQVLLLRFLLTISVACSYSVIVATPPEIIVQTGCVIKENDRGEIVDVDLSDRTLSESLITALTKLPELSVLRLRRTSISDEQLGRFITLKLRMIDLRNTNITDDGLVHLAKIKSLVDIQLEKSKVTDIGIQRLAGLNLKSFNANYCTSISNRSLAVLAAMPSMEQIQLDYTKINDTGMAVLTTASRLTRLRIRGVDITGAGLAHISQLKNLSRLNLRDTSLDDAGLTVIAALPTIDWLDISECRLATPDGLGQLKKASTLTYLDLWETKTNDDVLATFGGLTKLKFLNLKATYVTDNSLPVLLKLTELAELNVAGTQLTDTSFLALGKIPSLKKLNVANTDIGFDTIDSLTESRSDLEVIEFEN